MAKPGLVPKLSTEIMGHRAADFFANIDKPVGKIATIPEADEDWHPVVIQLYQSFAESGQSVRYQSSDWALLYTACESMSRDLKPKFVGMSEVWNSEVGQMEKIPVRESVPMNGASLGAYLKLMTVLLATEGDRRRHQMELQQPSSPESEDESNVVRGRTFGGSSA